MYIIKVIQGNMERVRDKAKTSTNQTNLHEPKNFTRRARRETLAKFPQAAINY